MNAPVVAVLSDGAKNGSTPEDAVEKPQLVTFLLYFFETYECV